MAQPMRRRDGPDHIWKRGQIPLSVPPIGNVHILPFGVSTLCSSGADQFAGVLATIGAGVANFNWSSDVNTLCHWAGSFFVSIGAERSE